jgi:hypothetical protein
MYMNYFLLAGSRRLKPLTEVRHLARRLHRRGESSGDLIALGIGYASDSVQFNQFRHFAHLGRHIRCVSPIRVRGNLHGLPIAGNGFACPLTEHSSRRARVAVIFGGKARDFRPTIRG